MLHINTDVTSKLRSGATCQELAIIADQLLVQCRLLSKGNVVAKADPKYTAQ